MGNCKWNNILIVDFHDIHLSSTDVWLFKNGKRFLVSFDFECVWLETFQNVFSQVQLSESWAFYRKNFLSSEIGGLQPPRAPVRMPMDSLVGTAQFQQNTESAGQKFVLKLIALSLQQLLRLFRCIVSVYYITDLVRCLWDLLAPGDVNWQNLRAGKTRSHVELRSISSHCSENEPAFSPCRTQRPDVRKRRKSSLVLSPSVGLTQYM